MTGVTAVAARHMLLRDTSRINFPQSIISAHFSHSFYMYWVSILYPAPFYVISFKKNKIKCRPSGTSQNSNRCIRNSQGE